MSISRLKMVTRISLVVEKERFRFQNGDEKGSRRQKMSISRLKMVTRISLVVEKERFRFQNGDENGSRRQKIEFPATKR
jgi:hypothetical protein